MGTARPAGYQLKLGLYAAVLLMGIAGLVAVTAAWAEEPAGSEQLINITVKDAAVAEVLHMIGRAGSVNVVVGAGVEGRIKSINLTDVTVEQALQYIALAQNLYWRKLGNAYLVSAQPPPMPVAPQPPQATEVAPGLLPPMYTPQATSPEGQDVAHLAGGVPPAPPPVGSSARIVTAGPGDKDFVVDTIDIQYTDPGHLAEMFGGYRVEDSRFNFEVPRSWHVNPFDRSRLRGGLAAQMSGFTEMQAPGAPGSVGWGQFGGYGGVGGGLGGGLGGFGGSAGGLGGLGGQYGGGLSGGYGGAGAGAGGFAQLLPQDMFPPIAYMPLNVLLVRGTQQSIDQFKEIISVLDQPVKQVRISTQFVEIEISADKALGIDWFVDNGSLGFFNQGFAPGQGLSVVRFSRGRFTAELRSLEQQGRAKIINEPSVVTQNNMPAEVMFSTTIPYFSATATYNEFGFRQVEFESDEVDVENALYVTPRINSDDTITLDLEPEIEDQVGQVVGPQGEVIPIVSSQSVYTRVTVADGETLAIGGMIRKNEVVNTRRTPLLSEIPLIGNLFRSQTRTVRNSELIIFVTPQIIRPLPRE